MISCCPSRKWTLKVIICSNTPPGTCWRVICWVIWMSFTVRVSSPTGTRGRCKRSSVKVFVGAIFLPSLTSSGQGSLKSPTEALIEGSANTFPLVLSPPLRQREIGVTEGLKGHVFPPRCAWECVLRKALRIPMCYERGGKGGRGEEGAGEDEEEEGARGRTAGGKGRKEW